MKVARPVRSGTAGPTKDFDDDLAAMSNADRAFFMDKGERIVGKNFAFLPSGQALSCRHVARAGERRLAP